MSTENTTKKHMTIPFRVGYNQRSGYVFIENTRTFTEFHFTITESRVIGEAILQAAEGMRRAGAMPPEITYIEMLDEGK